MPPKKGKKQRQHAGRQTSAAARRVGRRPQNGTGTSSSALPSQSSALDGEESLLSRGQQPFSDAFKPSVTAASEPAADETPGVDAGHGTPTPTRPNRGSASPSSSAFASAISPSDSSGDEQWPSNAPNGYGHYDLRPRRRLVAHSGSGAPPPQLLPSFFMRRGGDGIASAAVAQKLDPAAAAARRLWEMRGKALREGLTPTERRLWWGKLLRSTDGCEMKDSSPMHYALADVAVAHKEASDAVAAAFDSRHDSVFVELSRFHSTILRSGGKDAESTGKAVPWHALVPKRFAAQILDADINRSLWYWCSETDRPVRRAELRLLIVAVLLLTEDDAPRKLHYYQGMHDVAAAVLLASLGEKQEGRRPAQVRVSTKRELRWAFDIMQLMFVNGPLEVFAGPDLSGTLGLLRAVHTRIRAENPQVADQLETVGLAPDTHYAVAWATTWFAHGIHDLSVALRVFDALVASHHTAASKSNNDADNAAISTPIADFCAALVSQYATTRCDLDENSSDPAAFGRMYQKLVDLPVSLQVDDISVVAAKASLLANLAARNAIFNPRRLGSIKQTLMTNFVSGGLTCASLVFAGAYLAADSGIA